MEGTWRNINTFTYGSPLSITVDNGKIYLLQSRSQQSFVEIYDPVNNALSFCSLTPTYIGGGGSVIVDDKLYLFGPIGYCYDVRANTWRQFSASGYTRGGHITSYAQGRIVHIFSRTAHICFDIDTEKIMSTVIMPVEILRHANARIGNKFYFVGSYKTSDYKNLFIYDMVTDTWEVESMGFSGISYVCTAYQNKLICIGQAVGSSITYMRIYNPETKEWSLGPNLPSEALGSSNSIATAVGNSIYFLDGNSKLFIFGDDPTSVTHTITQQYQLEDGTLVQESDSQSIVQGGNYTHTAPKLTGYTRIGYRIDDGALTEGWSVQISNIQRDYTVTFVYTQGDEPEPPTQFTVTQRYQDKNGDTLRPDDSIQVDQGSTYIQNAPIIAGYVCEGYVLDEVGLFIGKEARITDVQGDHIIIFVYIKDEGEPDSEPGGNSKCCTKVEIKLTTCCGHGALLKEVAQALDKDGANCDCDCSGK